MLKNTSLSWCCFFASQVDGWPHQESDVDIAVLPASDLSFEAEVNLNTDLINILGNVNLTNLRKSPPLLMYAVFNKSQILFQKDQLIFPTYRAYAFISVMWRLSRCMKRHLRDYKRNIIDLLYISNMFFNQYSIEIKWKLLAAKQEFISTIILLYFHVFLESL